MLRRPNILTYRNVIYSEAAYGGLPVGYWPLDEANGTTATDRMTLARGTGNNGTYAGGVTLGVAGPISRENSRAVRTNGSNGQVALGNPAALQITGAITLETWINAASFGHAATFIGKGYDGTNEGYYFRFLNTGTPQLEGGSFSLSGGGFSAVWNLTWATGTTHHAVALYDGSAWKLFSDGVQVASATKASGALATSANAFLSCTEISGTTARFVACDLAHTAIYNYALSADRIKYHALAGQNGVAP